jgi:hypothetical protein
MFGELTIDNFQLTIYKSAEGVIPPFYRVKLRHVQLFFLRKQESTISPGRPGFLLSQE